MALYRVLTWGGEHLFSDSDRRICYKADTSAANPVRVWEKAENSLFAFTLFHSPSGSGKTTFIKNVYRYVQGMPSLLKFDFQPDHVELAKCSYGYIPQHPPFGRHWRLREFLPETPNFLDCFFPKRDVNEMLPKHLGEFSGGEMRKLYVCSAVEQLFINGSDAAFLVLDEVFDGLGAREAQRCISELNNKWTGRSSKPLYVMLVSHLDESVMIPPTLSVTRLALEVSNESLTQLDVRIYNKS